jgi:hypothetical protein
MPDSDREQQFLRAEHLVELHSAELKKELRLGDLVLSQMLYITGLIWLYVVLSIFPIIDVTNAASFTAKVSGVVIGINAAGALYFWRASKRRALTAIVGAIE